MIRKRALEVLRNCSVYQVRWYAPDNPDIQDAVKAQQMFLFVLLSIIEWGEYEREQALQS